MIPPDRMPASQPRDNVVVVEAVRILETGSPLPMITTRAMQVNMLVNELLHEMPDADFIEVRAIRYDVKEGNDERSTQPAPDA